MPLYCFTTDDGVTVEEIFQMGKAPESIVLPNGKKAKRNFAGEQRGARSGNAGWPIECISSGVNAEQAPELRKFFKERNFDCEVSDNGNPIYRDRHHRKRALRLRNLHDKASFGT